MHNPKPSYGKCGHSNLQGFIHMSTKQDQEYWYIKEQEEAAFWERLEENHRRHKLFLAALLLQEARGTEARYLEPPKKWRKDRYHWNR